MRHRSVQSRAGLLTAAAVMAIGLGATAAQATFVLDLKITGGGTATTVAAGAEVSLDVWGTVTSGTTNAAAEAIQDAFFGVVNTGTVGTIKPLLNGQGVALQGTFTGVATDVTPNVTTSYGGTLYGANPSYQSVGSTNSAAADNWVFARSTSMTTVTDGAQTLLGTLTFKVDAAATAGSSATLTLNARTASSLVVPAVWQEDGVEKDGTPGIGSFVTINVASTIVPGDANDDGKVDFNDFTILVNNYGATGIGGGHTVGDFNVDTNVDFNDFTILVNNYGFGTAPEGIALEAPTLAMVPEPASLSLVGLGLAGVAARRRRK